MKLRIFKLSLIFILIFSNQLFAERTIGVTKFENLTKDKKIAWLGIGIADSITMKLSRVKEFILVDRTNVEKILNEIKLGQSGLIDENSAKSVGKALGADIIVTGNYAKFGNRIRISAKLVEVESHKVLRQVQSTGTMLNIFELQDEIALKLIKESNVTLTNEIRNKIISDHKVKDITAYEYYSKGQNFYTKANYYKSIDMFKKAVDIDGQYDLAYSGLSKAYASLYWHESAILEKEKNPVYIENSHKFAKKALSLNPALDEAHVSMAKYYQNVNKKKVRNKWKKCIEEAQKAVDINPNNAEAYYILSRANSLNNTKEKKYLTLALKKNKFLVSAQLQMGIFYYDQKKYYKAEPYMKRAIEIEPRFILAYSWLGYLYNKMGDTYKAIELYKNALKRDPNYVFGLRNLGVYYRQVKDYDNAMIQFQKAVKIKKTDYRSWYEIGYLHQQNKKYRTALKNYKISIRYKPDYYFSQSNIAYTYSMLNQYDNAIKHAKKAHNIDRKKGWPASHIGWIYRVKLKDKSNALYWYKQALKREPNNSSYKKAVDDLR